MKQAYMDHAAATPVRPEVMEAMLPFFVERFGNPSAVYDLGSAIKVVMEEQRGKVARLIGARDDEIIFTSSGAEANNLAIKGLAQATFLKRGRHLIVSDIFEPEGDGLRLVNIFGEQKVIKATILRLNLVNHQVILVEK